MSVSTQPRGPGGKWGEKPDVGLARRMTDALRRSLGHDGTDDPPPPPADDDTRLAEQLATVETLPGEVIEVDAPDLADLDARLDAQLGAIGVDSDEPLEAVEVDAVEVPELAGAGKSLDERLALQEKALESVESDEDDDVDRPLFPDDEDPETKIRKWDPDLHPRDHRGRFATIGSTVKLPDSLGGGEARVLRASGGGNIMVRRADGTEIDVPAKDTEVTRSAAANAADRAFRNRPGAERFGGFGDDVAPTRAAGDGPAKKPELVGVAGLVRADPVNGSGMGRAQVEVDTPDGVATITRERPDQFRVHYADSNQRDRVLALGGRIQVIGEPRPVESPKSDADKGPSFPDGATVTTPDGTTGTVVATGKNGVGVRGPDGKLTVHPATDLTPADADTPNAGPTNAGSVREGDVVSWHALDGDVSGTVDKVQVDGRQTVLTVDGTEHRLLSDAQVDVGRENRSGGIGSLLDRLPASQATLTGDSDAQDSTPRVTVGNLVDALNADGDAANAKAVNQAGTRLEQAQASGDPEQIAMATARLSEVLDGITGHDSDVADVRAGLIGETQEPSRRRTLQAQLADMSDTELDAVIADNQGSESLDGMEMYDGALIERQRRQASAKPGGDLAADDGTDRSAWAGGVPPNGADGTGTRPDGEPWGTGYPPADPRNDPAYDQYTTELDAKLEATLAEIGDTETIHDKVDGVPGAYRPERQAQHDELLADLMAGFAGVPKESKAIVMAGPPGAGKTTVLKTDGTTFGVEMDGGTPRNYAVVNPDDMKELIVERGLVPDDYPGRGIGDWEPATFLHEESSHLAARLLTQRQAEGYNVILDGTFSGNPDKQAGKVKSLREGGYTVTGVLVDGTVDRSLENAARRHRKPPATPGGAYTGRYVPYDLIESNRSSGGESAVFGRPHRNRASENIEAVQAEFDGGVLWYDNATGQSRLVHRVGPGQEVITGTDVSQEGKTTDTDETKAGGADRNRGNAERLRRYWTRGAGAAKIGWGTEGDFNRCVTLLSEHMLPERAKGYCNLRHQEAVGAPPGKGHKALLELGLGPMLPGLEVKADPPATDPDANAEGVENTNPDPTGVMVALYPPDDIAQAIALDAEGAETVTNLHATLAFLGTVEDIGIDRVGDLVTLVRDFAEASYDQAAEINGLARWEAGDDGDALVALVDGPELPDLRADLVDALTAAGFEVRTDHGFTPHITLAYLPPDAATPLERLEALPATFGFLSVAVGADVWDFPLNADEQEDQGAA